MWIALPEAKTITDRIQMSGEPVTLSSIESSVKKGLNEKDGTEESVFCQDHPLPLPPYRSVDRCFGENTRTCIYVTGRCIQDRYWSLHHSYRRTVDLLTHRCVRHVVSGIFTVPVDSSWNDWYVTSPNVPLEVFRRSFPVGSQSSHSSPHSCLRSFSHCSALLSSRSGSYSMRTLAGRCS